MGDYTSCDQYRKSKIIAERECTVPRLGVRHRWVTDLSKMMAEKLVDYILITLTMKRTPRTKRIAETVLGHLCDVTGIKTTLSTAKTKIERLMILIADRLAIWIDGMVRDMLKKKVRHEKRPTELPMKPIHVISRPETIVCRVSTDDEESEEDIEKEEEEREEENEDEEQVEKEETVTEDEVTENEEENIKEEEEEEEVNDKEEEINNEEEEINNEEEEINNKDEEIRDEDKDQLEEPEDEEEYEAESEKEGIEDWAEEEEIELEELGEAEEDFMEEVQEQVEEEEEPAETKLVKTPAVIPPLFTAGRAFEVKTGSECHYEIKQLSSTTVAKKVALAKGKEPTIIRKIPKTDSPLNIKSLKEWAKWAKEVVGTAEQWGHWLDKTIVDFEKRRKLVQQKTAQDPSKAEAYNKEYSQWLKEQQAMYTAFRVEKKRIKEDVQQWDKKLENKLKHDSNPEVETNVHNL